MLDERKPVFGEAGHGVEAPTTTPQQPETREGNNSIGLAERARSFGREALGALRRHRRRAISVTAISAAVAAGFVYHNHTVNALQAHMQTIEGSGGGVPSEALPNPDDRPNSKEYGKNKEAGEALEALGREINYAMNRPPEEQFEAKQMLANAIPGSYYEVNSLQPDSLTARLEVIHMLKMGTHPSGSRLPKNYEYVFSLVPHEPLQESDNLSIIYATLTTGDRRPTANPLDAEFEYHYQQPVAVTMSTKRHPQLSGPNANGGWAIVDISPIERRNMQANDSPIVLDANGKPKIYTDRKELGGRSAIPDMPPLMQNMQLREPRDYRSY